VCKSVCKIGRWTGPLDQGHAPPHITIQPGRSPEEPASLSIWTTALALKFPQSLKQKTDEELTIKEIIARIESLNAGLKNFWSKANGWAPIEAAGLLSKSRLDWQVSLSASLRNWLRDPPVAISEGDLILAWANLGSLVEGTLKLLLSVYHHDYQSDIDALKAANAYDHKKGKPKSPDGLQLEQLRQFVMAHDLLGAEGDALVDLVQQRRNAIHAFKDRPIGTGAEFQAAVRGYLKLLRSVNNRLPYPDEQYVPREF
jgi:hypothetical protein